MIHLKYYYNHPQQAQKKYIHSMTLTNFSINNEFFKSKYLFNYLSFECFDYIYPPKIFFCLVRYICLLTITNF